MVVVVWEDVVMMLDRRLEDGTRDVVHGARDQAQVRAREVFIG